MVCRLYENHTSILKIKHTITASKTTNNSNEVSSEEVKKHLQQLNHSKDTKGSMSLDSVSTALIKIAVNHYQLQLITVFR